MKFQSRNHAKTNIDKVICPYCKHSYLVSEETEDDYEMFKNTKIHWCRKCQESFINGITKDITYKYS